MDVNKIKIVIFGTDVNKTKILIVKRTELQFFVLVKVKQDRTRLFSDVNRTKLLVCRKRREYPFHMDHKK